MPETTVTDAGYTIERRACVTEIKDRAGVLIAFAVIHVGDAWTVTVAPWVVDPHCPPAAPDDFRRFLLTNRGEAERLLEFIVQLHAWQRQVSA